MLASFYNDEGFTKFVSQIGNVIEMCVSIVSDG